MGRKLAKGTELQMGDGAGPEVFTKIAQLTNIGGPSMSRGTQDVSDHDTADAKEFIGDALLDGGEIPFEGHLDPSLPTHDEATGVIKAMTDGVKRNYKIVFPGGLGAFTVAGIMIAFEPQAPHDGKLTFSARLKVSGLPVFA